MEPISFRDADGLRAWLEEHHTDRDELWIAFRKKTGNASQGLSYSDALDEALCFGWIDGIRKAAGDGRYVMRFTPRKPKSIWSQVNITRVEKLTKAGRMTAAGIAAFEARTAARTRIHSFENDARDLDPARNAKLRANRRAHAFFEAQTPSYRRTAAFWVMSAKKDDTRDRRLETLISASADGEFAPPFRFSTSKPKAPPKTARPTPKRPRS